MTVKELIQELQDTDGDRLVVLSIDEEGNAFHELEECGEYDYHDDGEISDDEDGRSGGTPALVLWP